MVSAAYLALTGESRPASGLAAHWRLAYRFLPWEDWRSGRPTVIDHHVIPALEKWVDDGADAAERDLRKTRGAISFGLEESPWDGERVLDRYELKSRLPGKAATIGQGVAGLLLLVYPEGLLWWAPVVGVINAIGVADYMVNVRRMGVAHGASATPTAVANGASAEARGRG